MKNRKAFIIGAALVISILGIICWVPKEAEEISLSNTQFNGYHTEYLYPTTVSKLPTSSYLRNKKLTVKAYDNAIIVPFHLGVKKRINGAGVFKDGKYVSESQSYTRGWWVYDNDNQDIKIINEDAFYCGIYHRHWGHFLMESISRLWPVALNPEKYKKTKFVFINLYNHKNPFPDGPYLELLNLLGIKKEQLLIVDQPTRFKKVIVAEESWGFRHEPSYGRDVPPYYTREWQFLIHTLIKQALNQKSNIQLHDKVFLSLHNLEAKRRKRYFGLDEIETLFTSNGFYAFSPEEHSLADQIKTIYHAKQIAVPQGSIAHNLMFANPDSEVVIFNRSQTFDVNQANIAEATNKKQNTYFLDTWGISGALNGFGWSKWVHFNYIPNALLLKWANWHHFKIFPICRTSLYEDFMFHYIPKNTYTKPFPKPSQQQLSEKEYSDIKKFSYWPDQCEPVVQ